MAIEMLKESQVEEQAQLDLVNKYSELRKKGEIESLLTLVTEDFALESALSGPVKGKDAFKLYLAKQKAGVSELAEMVDGIVQCKGKAKLLFLPITFLAKFQIIADPTSDGCLIEKIVLGRA